MDLFLLNLLQTKLNNGLLWEDLHTNKSGIRNSCVQRQALRPPMWPNNTPLSDLLLLATTLTCSLLWFGTSAATGPAWRGCRALRELNFSWSSLENQGLGHRIFWRRARLRSKQHNWYFIPLMIHCHSNSCFTGKMAEAVTLNQLDKTQLALSRELILSQKWTVCLLLALWFEN